MGRRVAIVRPPTPSFVAALGQVDGAPPIDLPRALAQHEAYCQALAADGYELLRLPGDDGCPDACFVEDTAVVVGDAALITRPGAPSRRAETAAVAWALGNLGLALTVMEHPATLDGGDVLRLGRTIIVGASARTNREGIMALRSFAERHGLEVEVVPVPLGVLHLKCHATPLDEDTLLAAPGWLDDLRVARPLRRIEVPAAERYAANALALRSRVLVAAAYPRTQALVSAAGYHVQLVDMSEFSKADGSLTCVSLEVDLS